MAICKRCHETFEFSELNTDGYCEHCASKRNEIKTRLAATVPQAQPASAQKKPRPVTGRERLDRIVLTTETALDVPIYRRLGIVSAEAVVGMNIIKDLMIEVRDLTGGRSKTAQSAMQETKLLLFDEIRDQASSLGADMIIGISLRFSDFGARGGAIMATILGTAIQTEESKSSS